MRLAARRLEARRPDWAQAMLNERTHVSDDNADLGWAFGCLRASYATEDPARLLYLPALAVGVTLMAIYEWSADESLLTAGLTALLCLALGVVRPGRELISGLCIGLVVTGVMAFEAVTGVRPSYETHTHSVLHSLRWTIFLLPAFGAALIGAQLGRWLRLSPQ
jgi:hypothetical protein